MSGYLIAMVVLAVVILLLLMWLVGKLFRRVGPNRALITYGWGGTHIVTGGGKVVRAAGAAGAARGLPP